ncbi:MAG: hypothetical protein B7Z64_11395, partial [Acidiphilium sp. 21-68-69]
MRRISPARPPPISTGSARRPTCCAASPPSPSAAGADRHNGSTDRTLAILLALRDEGLPISVFQARAVGFDEARVNTWLYETADGLHRPDWVAFLDVDEFIVAGEDGLAPLLAPLLAAAPAPAVALPLVNYHDTADDDPAELVIPRRLRWRARQMPPVPKVIVRGGFGARCAIA